MKSARSFIIFIIIAALSSSAWSRDLPSARNVEDENKKDVSIVAEPDVVVTLCLASGGIVVRGWDKREVRARASGGEKIALPSSPAAATAGARRVDVLVGDEAARTPAESGWCEGTGSIELDVPRGATVNLQIREGGVEVSQVAEARVESINGDVNLERISKTVEATCLSGDISLADSVGRVHLRTVSGEIEATNVRPLEASDTFSAGSTSGEVTLQRISHTQVKAATVSGSIRMSGALTRGGDYEFRTTNGDLTLTLPPDASFRLSARAVASGEVITDFPVKANAGEPGVKEAHQDRLAGVVGTGDASLNLTTFSGTVQIKRQ